MVDIYHTRRLLNRLMVYFSITPDILAIAMPYVTRPAAEAHFGCDPGNQSADETFLYNRMVQWDNKPEGNNESQIRMCLFSENMDPA